MPNHSTSRISLLSLRSSRSFFRRFFGRKLLCLVLILSLIILPAPSSSFSFFPVLASVAVSTTGDSLHRVAKFFKSLFAPSHQSPQREKLADRRARVSNIRISPHRFAGYEGDVIRFTALPSDSINRVVQGVTFTWESSDTDKLQIDSTGRALCLQPGDVTVTCSAGYVQAQARIRIRSGSRPIQTDSQWADDHESVTTTNPPGSGASAFLPQSIFEKLSPTAHAQVSSAYIGNDSPYSELATEECNLTGLPSNRVSEGARMGLVLPESHNFNLGVPIFGLGGRGVGTGLTLYHNSRVWGRHGSAVTFDPIASWPSPGYSLGFGRIIDYAHEGSPTLKRAKYIFITPDGTRYYLGQSEWDNYAPISGELPDGPHVSFSGSYNSFTLKFNDGSVVYFYRTNNRLLPGWIQDSNGNYITITYKEFTDPPVTPPQAIDYITDTLGRVIEFNYDSGGKLTSIDAPGFDDTTQTIVEFDYQSLTVSSSFSGLTVENMPSGAIRVLRHVYFPATGTGYRMDYSVYGMAYNFSARRAMSSTSGTISSGNESAATSFNYPTTASSLTDAPSFTQRSETATSSPSSTFSYSSSTGSLTKTYIIIRPDSSKIELTRSTDSSSVANGRLVKTEIKDSSSTVFSKTELAYANDSAGFAQVQAVTSYDDAGTPTKVDFDYDGYGNLVNMREYGHQISSQWKVRRRVKTTYKTDTAYINAHIRSLPTLVEVFDAQENTTDSDDVLLNKSALGYDDYSAMGGMENYGGTASPPGHDSNYGTSLTVRGNVTSSTEWIDLVADTSITRKKKYDIFGNVVKAEVSCCSEQTVTLTEDFSWAIPEQVTKGGSSGPQLTLTVDSDYNTGKVKEQTSANGQTVNYTYDEALAVSDVSLPTGAIRENDYDYDNLISRGSVTYDDGGSDKTIKTETKYDGWGRVIEQVSAYTGTSPGASDAKVKTVYDAMGRVESRSNPYAANGSPSYETSYEYDVLGRITETTLPDGDTIETSYDGDEVTTTDQVNRKIKRESDSLGRLVKVTEQNTSGTLSQETDYTYDLLDRLVEVDQGGQLRKYKYDLLGRSLYEKIPEQTATINDGTGTYWTTKFTYTSFNKVDTKTDARGVITTYSYDALHRLTGVSYNTSGATGVATTKSLAYTYGTTGVEKGLLLSVEVGTLSAGGYKEEYNYDDFGRVESLERHFSTTRVYTTAYEMNEAGQRKELTYPSSRVINYSYDTKGRMSSGGGLSNITYNLVGQVISSDMANGVEEEFGYDAARMQMTTHTATNTWNDNMVPPQTPVTDTFIDLTYDYEASAGENGAGSTAGNSGQLMGVSGTIDGQTESAAYTYDNVGRLVTSSQTTGGASAARRFGYDRWGNRTGVWDAVSGGTQIQSVSLVETSSIPNNQIASVTDTVATQGQGEGQGEGTTSVTYDYTYDAAGNVTDDEVNSYVYDGENRLVSVNSGAQTYEYDHQNRRIAKTVSSTTTQYVWEGSQVIAEHAGSTGSAIVGYVYAGGRMVYKVEGSVARYFLSDRLSVRLMLSPAATITGEVTVEGKQSHLPFGEAMATSGDQDKHRFTSYERESSIGLDYAVNRWHLPGVGRFFQADPYRGSGGVSVPQSWNRYSYAHNDAINSIDPMGLLRLISCPPGQRWEQFPNGGGRCVPEDSSHFLPDGGSGMLGGYEDPFVIDTSGNTEFNNDWGESQSLWDQFWKLNRCEKEVALQYPFANFKIIETRKLAEDWAKAQPGGDEDGTKTNASKHCIWSCAMTKALNANIAKKWGTAHECDKKGNLMTDANAKMDLHNNAVGRSIGVNPETKSMKDCIEKCKNSKKTYWIKGEGAKIP